MDKRERWFDEGAPLFRRALETLGLGDRLPPTGDYYACPCCLIALPRQAIAEKTLTEEHVPPEQLGGRGLLLTCMRCNNNAGTNFDAHAIRQATFENFLAGQGPSVPLPATMFADGLPLRGTVQHSGPNGILLMGISQQNDPKAEAAHWQALEAMAHRKDSALSLPFTINPRFNPDRAKVSWVRSAYLAAFATLGWSYILRPVLGPIRDQLANAAAEIIPPITTYDPTAATSRRQIMLVETPEDIRSVLVIMGRYGVFLPGLWEPLSCDELSQVLGRRVESDGRLHVNFAGKEVDWPSWPRYLCDQT